MGGREARNRGHIFINNIPLSIHDQELGDIFSKYGPVNNAWVCYPKPGFSYTYGFVEFKHVEDAFRAVSLFGRDKRWDFKVELSRNLPVDDYLPPRRSTRDYDEDRSPRRHDRPPPITSKSRRSPNPPPRRRSRHYDDDEPPVVNYGKIIVNNLALDVDHDELQYEFGKIGRVVAVWLSDDVRRNARFAFVQFDRKADAAMAVEKFRSRPFGWRVAFSHQDTPLEPVDLDTGSLNRTSADNFDRHRRDHGSPKRRPPPPPPPHRRRIDERSSPTPRRDVRERSRSPVAYKSRRERDYSPEEEGQYRGRY